MAFFLGLFGGGGGHKTKQSINTTSDTVTNAAFNSVQKCYKAADGTQIFNITGSNDIVTGNTQKLNLVVDVNECASDVNQDGKFKDTISNKIAQSLKDQEVALTQGLDNSKDIQNTKLLNKVRTNLTFNDVQNCNAKLDGTQIFNVAGNNDIVENNAQEQTLDLFANCMKQSGQTADVIHDITNTINQHSTYTSKNPFAFITDAIKEALKSAMIIAAVVFIAIIAFVFIYEVSGKKDKSSDDTTMSDNTTA